MSLYAFMLIAVVIAYVEMTRRRDNKKLSTEIRKVKREVRYQLDLLNKMFEEEEKGEPVISPAHVSTQKLATVLERTEKK